MVLLSNRKRTEKSPLINPLKDVVWGGPSVTLVNFYSVTSGWKLSPILKTKELESRELCQRAQIWTYARKDLNVRLSGAKCAVCSVHNLPPLVH